MDQGIKGSKVIGQNIKKHRKLHKLTQEDLITKLQVLECDLSRGTFAKIEAGIRHISVSELKAIRLVLKMEYRDFFE